MNQPCLKVEPTILQRYSSFIVARILSDKGHVHMKLYIYKTHILKQKKSFIQKEGILLL